MFERIKRLKNDELLFGSIVLMILLNVGYFFNYIFHFSMAAMLGPLDYGILAVLTNIIYIFSIPTVSIQILVSSYATKFKIENGKLKWMFNFLLKKVIIAGLILFFFYTLMTFWLSKELNIPQELLILTGVFIFPSFLLPISVGIFQGLKKFYSWGFNFLSLSVLKLIISIVLVLIGFRVYGALLGFIIGVGMGFLISLPSLREILKSKSNKDKIEIYSEKNLSILLAMLIVVLMYTLDVIIVKMIFNAQIAGEYALASLIGKIIFFGTSAIGNAMFPISSEKFENGYRGKGVIKKTFLSVFFLSGIAIFLLWFYPLGILKILMLYSKYASISPILGYVGVAFSFISFVNIIVLYKISTDKIRFKQIIFLFIFLIIQIITFFMFNKDIMMFSKGFMYSSIAIFILSLIFLKK